METTAKTTEWLRCAESPTYFTDQYIRIYEAESGEWVPFRLWPAQARTLRLIHNNQLTVILKARQLGITWLVLSYGLWLLLFRPEAEILLFSRRDDEAVHLLDDRLKGMYKRLPVWLQAAQITGSNNHTFELSNGSTARAFPTSAGDSYTAKFAMVDEADLAPDFNRLMRAVKPTIDTGGKMVILSRADKSTPQSEFKRTYRAAKGGRSPWKSIFLPWTVRPNRDADWYRRQRDDIQSRTGSLDDLYEQYPASDLEALMPRMLDKRIPGEWLLGVYVPLPPVNPTPVSADGMPDTTRESWEVAKQFPMLDAKRGGRESWSGEGRIYIPRIVGRKYVIGADPAEGNPTSDASVAIVLDQITGEEVATLTGQYQPAVFASHIVALAQYYNNAAILVERNNHGHAVLVWFELEAPNAIVLEGTDRKRGWMSSTLGKALMYARLTEDVREKLVTIHDEMTYEQLTMVEGATLKAPEGEHDDHAIAMGLADMARTLAVMQQEVVIRPGVVSLYGSRERVN
jgi:hypothetical protein